MGLWKEMLSSYYLANAPDTSKFSTGSLTKYLVFPL